MTGRTIDIHLSVSPALYEDRAPATAPGQPLMVELRGIPVPDYGNCPITLTYEWVRGGADLDEHLLAFIDGLWRLTVYGAKYLWLHDQIAPLDPEDEIWRRWVFSDFSIEINRSWTEVTE